MKTSKQMRVDPLFMRNEFPVSGKYGFPLIKKQRINLEQVSLIACSDTRSNESEENKKRGVHFFVDDFRFTGIYTSPDRSLKKYSQYSFLLSPDYSTYADMNPWRQIESIAHNRWVGAYCQSKGLTVIPTISLSTPSSYEYCFDAIEKGSIVAIGMIGCKKSKEAFLSGYREMLKKIEPEAVICFGTPFPEMTGNLIKVDYLESRRRIN